MSLSSQPQSLLVHWQIFETRQMLAASLASKTAEALTGRIASDGRAAVALSGGSTPRLFLEQLSQAPLDWSRIYVTLVDERWVAPGSERSNETLLRQALLRHAAKGAHFVSLKTAAIDPETALDEIESRIRQMPLPFAAVILGMGEDGHTASLFPLGDQLGRALDPLGERAVQSMRAPGVLEARVTLTFPVLKAADFLALHIEGEKKRQVFLQAEQDGPTEEMPIRAFLRAGRPLEVFWAA